MTCADEVWYEQSQLDLDAQFARSLQMQEESDLHERIPPPSQMGEGGLPYQPRLRRTRGAGAGAGGGDMEERYGQQRGGEYPPGMLALEDRIEKYAEGTSVGLSRPPSPIITFIHPSLIELSDERHGY